MSESLLRLAKTTGGRRVLTSILNLWYMCMLESAVIPNGSILLRSVCAVFLFKAYPQRHPEFLINSQIENSPKSSLLYSKRFFVSTCKRMKSHLLQCSFMKSIARGNLPSIKISSSRITAKSRSSDTIFSQHFIWAIWHPISPLVKGLG